MSLDPTTIRVSDTLLLSDMVGCDSIYRRGYANPVEWDTNSQYYREARYLGVLLDELHQEYGPYSVSYGYICPDLSKKIVKYMDPNKPSYHRWDDGAAIDVCFHDWVGGEDREAAPIYLAAEVDEFHDYSRMITYSESEWICLARRVSELGKVGPRKAFYENRYEGEKKPHFIKYSQNEASRAQQRELIELEHDWRGQGHPSHHGGGREQFHHIRLSDHVVLSDLLYKAKYVHKGIKNLPPVTDHDKMDAFMEKAVRVANTIEVVMAHTAARVSVVQGYDRRKCWTEHQTPIEIVPHLADAQEVADVLCGNAVQAEVRTTRNGIERVRFYI